jgi:PPOX class probable F420-dependent enzyme
MTDEEVSALLADAKKLQLGTINPDGTPHMVTMFHAMIDGKIGFWTYGSSQKARNMARDPRVTCLLEQGEDYFELRGALVYGKVELITDPGRVRTIGAEVVKRMMGLTDEKEIAPFVEATAAKRYAYLVEPTRVASWDHRKLT